VKVSRFLNRCRIFCCQGQVYQEQLLLQDDQKVIDRQKRNVLQSNDSSYSWRANFFYFCIYEW
jgi:hypothetical protein